VLPSPVFDILPLYFAQQEVAMFESTALMMGEDEWSFLEAGDPSNLTPDNPPASPFKISFYNHMGKGIYDEICW